MAATSDRDREPRLAASRRWLRRKQKGSSASVAVIRPPNTRQPKPCSTSFTYTHSQQGTGVFASNRTTPETTWRARSLAKDQVCQTAQCSTQCNYRTLSSWYPFQKLITNFICCYFLIRADTFDLEVWQPTFKKQCDRPRELMPNKTTAHYQGSVASINSQSVCNSVFTSMFTRERMMPLISSTDMSAFLHSPCSHIMALTRSLDG